MCIKDPRTKTPNNHDLGLRLVIGLQNLLDINTVKNRPKKKQARKWDVSDHHKLEIPLV